MPPVSGNAANDGEIPIVYPDNNKGQQNKEPSQSDSSTKDRSTTTRRPRENRDDQSQGNDGRSRKSQSNREAGEQSTGTPPEPPAKPGPERQPRSHIPSSKDERESRPSKSKERDDLSTRPSPTNSDSMDVDVDLELQENAEIAARIADEQPVEVHRASVPMNYAAAASANRQQAPDSQSLPSGVSPAPGDRVPHNSNQSLHPLDPRNQAGPPPGLPATPRQHGASRPRNENSDHVQQEGSDAKESQPGLLARWGYGASTPRDKYKEDAARAKEELSRAFYEIRRLQEESRRLANDSSDWKQRWAEADHERQRNRDTVNSLRHELNGVHRELEEAKALSDTRGKELLGAQVFLTKADSLSISDVKAKVDALNDEVFQAAASVQDAFVHSSYTLPTEALHAAKQLAVEVIGKPMTHILHNGPRNPDVNPLLVQIVFQILLSRFCTVKIQAWFLGGQETSNFLSTLYEEIKYNENQAVSGRWRALTRKHARPSSDGWKQEILDILESVKKVASWSFVEPEKQEGFIQKLEPIFKAIADIRIALGEQFTSADIEVVLADARAAFSPQWMEDAWGDSRQGGSRQKDEFVVGTTGIGLKRLVPYQESKEPDTYIPVLPMKVILSSTVEEIINPPPREPSRRRAKPRVEGDQDGGGRSRT